MIEYYEILEEIRFLDAIIKYSDVSNEEKNKLKEEILDLQEKLRELNDNQNWLCRI